MFKKMNIKVTYLNKRKKQKRRRLTTTLFYDAQEKPLFQVTKMLKKNVLRYSQKKKHIFLYLQNILYHFSVFPKENTKN